MDYKKSTTASKLLWLCGFVQYRIKEEQRNAGSNV